MTVSSTTNRNNYTGNDTTATYNYGFRIFQEGDLLVTVRNTTTDVETTLAITTDYTVTGVGDASGGTIVLVGTGKAWQGTGSNLNTGYALSIRRVVGLTQITDIRNQGDFYPEVHEDEFDKSRMIDQQQQDEIDRSLKLSESIDPATFDATIPAEIVGETNITVMTDADGDAFVAGPTATEISNAQTYATQALASKDLAEEWATKVDGIVDATDYSAKAWSIGGTGVTDTASAGAAKEWATETASTVDTSEYSAKEYAQGTQTRGASGSAKDWSTYTGGTVDASEYSAKEYAQGTQTRGTTGSAKDWATYTGGTVDASEYSAKYYANQAANAAAATLWNDVVYVTNASSPVAPVDASSGTLYSVDATSGNVVINLPSIAVLTLSAPWSIGIKRTDASANTVTINANGTDTLEGSASITLDAQNLGVTIIPDTDATPDQWAIVNYGAQGDVVGPASSTDNALVRFDTTSGKAIQNSGVTLDDSDNLVSPGTIYVGAGAKNASAVVQYDSTTQGVAVPRMTAAQRDAISTPLTGLEVFNTDTNQKNIYNGSTWIPIGSGGGSLDYFYSADFVTLDSGDFTLTGSGSVADETSAPIEGDRSIKFTQASGSLGDTLDSANITLDLNQKDTTIGFSGRYTYDGNNNEIDFVIYDVTNSQELSRVSLPAASAATTFRCIANTLSTTATIKYYFEVMTENIGAVLLFDVIEGKTNPLPTVESVESETFYAYWQSNFWDAVTDTDEWDHSLILDKNKNSDPSASTSNLFTISDVSGQTRIIASKDILLDIDLSSTADLNGILYIKDSAGQIHANSQAAASGGYRLNASATMHVSAGDYVYLQNDNPATGAAGSVTITAQATSANVVFQGRDDSVEFHETTGGRDASFWDATGDIYTFDTTLIPLTNSQLVEWNDTTQTRLVAKKDIKVDVVINADSTSGSVMIYDSSGNAFSVQQASSNTSISTSASFKLTEGDYVYFRSSNASARWGGLTLTAEAISEKIYSVPVANDVENVYSARIDGSAGASVSVLSQSSSFIDSVSNGGTGVFTVNFKSGFFTEAPVVTVDAEIDANAVINVVPSTSSVQVYLANRTTDVAVNKDFTIIVQRQGSDYKAPKGYFLGNLSQPVVTIKDVKANGTNGGTFTSAAWQTRDLNTVDDASGIGVTVSSNQFTLPVGTYEIEATSPAFSVNTHQIKLRNITDSTNDIVGESSYANQTNLGGSPSRLTGVITITGAKVFEIQHYASATQSGNGFGVANSFGINEVYTQVKIRKLR